MGSLTHFAHSLVQQLKFMTVFTLKSLYKETNVFDVVTRNMP